MCYAAGSIDHAVDPCPMCKVFPHTKCPHVRETCRNRSLHPRMDVLYIKNAEVDRFNGCGFCKWARNDPPPPPEFLRYNNPGWPGCCRAPFPTEYSTITAAEWPAVSVVHNISIPLDIKAVLDALPRGPPMASFPSAPPSSLSRASARPGYDRKNSGGGSPSTKPSNLSKTPAKTRSGGSPQSPVGTLTRMSGSAVSLTLPQPEDNPKDRRYRSGNATPERNLQSSNSSPIRRNIDIDNPSTPPTPSTPVRRPSHVRRPTITPATTSVSVSKVVANNSPAASGGRRSSVSKPEKKEAVPPPTSTTSPSTRSAPPRPNPLVISTAVKRSEEDKLSSASSSSGSSDGVGSLSDNTVTSDGAFTDYLSDESEAELQRQAEAKAALLAINMAEELEFKAARLKLAHVDLRPPKSWNPTNLTNSPGGRYPNKDVSSPLGTTSISARLGLGQN